MLLVALSDDVGEYGCWRLGFGESDRSQRFSSRNNRRGQGVLQTPMAALTATGHHVYVVTGIDGHTVTTVDIANKSPA